MNSERNSNLPAGPGPGRAESKIINDSRTEERSNDPIQKNARYVSESVSTDDRQSRRVFTKSITREPSPLSTPRESRNPSRSNSVRPADLRRTTSMKQDRHPSEFFSQAIPSEPTPNPTPRSSFSGRSSSRPADLQWTKDRRDLPPYSENAIISTHSPEFTPSPIRRASFDDLSPRTRPSDFQWSETIEHHHGAYHDEGIQTDYHSDYTPSPTPRRSTFSGPAPSRPADLQAIRAAYCARCMFWVSEGWISTEARLQGLTSYIDPDTTGLDMCGQDIDGHTRIDSKICPVCIRERLIASESRSETERETRSEALDDLLKLWCEGRLIKGMRKDIMMAKKMILAQYLRGDPYDLVDENGNKINVVASGAIRRDLRKVTKANRYEGKWQAATFGLCAMGEVLSRM